MEASSKPGSTVPSSFPLLELPLETLDIVLIHMPIKDVITLKRTAPAILHIYSGTNWEQHMHRRLRDHYTFVSIAHRLGSVNAHQDPIPVVEAKLLDCPPSRRELEGMCEKLDTIDNIISDFTWIALKPTREVSYRAWPVWTSGEILREQTQLELSARASDEGWPRDCEQAESCARELLWDNPSDLSTIETDRLRQAFLYLSMVCTAERNIRSLDSYDTVKAQQLASVFERHIPTGLPRVFIEAVSCAYTYLYQRWKGVVSSTRMGYGTHAHDADTWTDCEDCRWHDSNLEGWAHWAVIHGPEALCTELSGNGNATWQSEKGRKWERLLEFLYGNQSCALKVCVCAYDHYLWPRVLEHVQRSTKAIPAGSEGTNRQAARLWGTPNTLWTMVGHHQSPSWIKEWYSHRQPRRHGNWKLGGLTVRGWVIWEEDRVGRLGWTDTAMAGWLAEGQPGWWDENDKWETINSYAYVITGGEPEPEPDKTVALPYQELWPNEEAVRDQ